MMNKFLVEIAGFNIINTDEWIDPYVYGELPEKGSYYQSFEDAGYGDLLLISNVSFGLWLCIFNMAAFLIVCFPVWLFNKLTGKIVRFKDILQGYFVWNGLIRLFMELFMELFLTAVLNVYTAVWDSPYSAEKYSNSVSVVILVFTATFLTFYFGYSCKNFR